MYIPVRAGRQWTHTHRHFPRASSSPSLASMVPLVPQATWLPVNHYILPQCTALSCTALLLPEVMQESCCKQRGEKALPSSKQALQLTASTPPAWNHERLERLLFAAVLNCLNQKCCSIPFQAQPAHLGKGTTSLCLTEVSGRLVPKGRQQ